jgi:hypothetical protein
MARIEAVVTLLLNGRVIKADKEQEENYRKL